MPENPQPDPAGAGGLGKGSGVTNPVPIRQRRPSRRPSHTETLQVDGQTFTATVGFDPETGQPRELFLTAGKEGSLLSALLADAAVVISVALQHGVPAAALAKSVGRLPAGPVAPVDFDNAPGQKVPASPIGAALDLVSAFERERSE